MEHAASAPFDPPADCGDGTDGPTAERPQRRRVLRWSLAAALVVAALGGVTVLRSRGGEKDALYLAVVAGMTGPSPDASQDILQGAELYLSEVNSAGGIRGHPVRLKVFDDRDDPAVARQRAQEIVGDKRIVAVIGHRTSPASLAAGPVYGEAGMPIITPTATADGVTENRPWFYRGLFSNTAEGLFIGDYLTTVLGDRRITLIGGSDDYSHTLAEGVRSGLAGRADVRTLALDTSSENNAEAWDSALAGIGRGEGDDRTVVVTLPEFAARRVVVTLRRSGFGGRIFGGDALGSDALFAHVSGSSGHGGGPDFTENLYAVAPLINDALSGDGVRWFSAFTETYGREPTWRAATSYQAALALVQGLRSPLVTLDTTKVTNDRKAIIDQVAALDSPARSLHGVIGPVWFDANQSAVMPVAVGVGRGGRFVSAPDQLQPAADQTDPAVPRYERKRVVTVGLTLNEISEVAAQNESFDADFFVWLKFTGEDDVTDIEFPNAADPAETTLGTPVRASEAGTMAYRLYRVRGTFRTRLSFHDFPFDRQALTIELQHRTLSSSRVVYAADVEILTAAQRQRLTSGANAADSVLTVNDWVADEVVYFQSTVGASRPLGDPTIRGGQSGVSYSRFVTEVTIHRDLRPFLVKNILPLLLLAAATYVSLFFTHAQTAERVTFGITGILTGAVLLAEVTSSLPNVGYAVAIQWGYYLFILLAASCVIVAIRGDSLQERGRMAAVRRLDLVSRIAYPVAALVTMVAYIVRFG